MSPVRLNEARDIGFGGRRAQMRIANRAGLGLGKARTLLLAGVVTIAMMAPIDVAFSQGGTGSLAQANLFTVIDLTPSGFTNSHAWGIFGGQQVGDGYDQATGRVRALLWRGSAASVVDLNPSGFVESEARSICGDQQVGSGSGPTTGSHRHALLWRSSADSVVDLHPTGFDASEALGTAGGQQVGYGLTRAAAAGVRHALLWRGSAASVVDLNPVGFTDSYASATSGEQQVGSGDGHALLWHGSAASVVDLHPSEFGSSQALGISGDQQVGWGFIDIGAGVSAWESRALLWRGSARSAVNFLPGVKALAISGDEQVGVGVDGHALMWRGSGASVVDLHAFLPPGFETSYAAGIDSNGDVVGFASGSESYSSHAFLWKRNTPKAAPSPGQDIARCEIPETDLALPATRHYVHQRDNCLLDQNSGHPAFDKQSRSDILHIIGSNSWETSMNVNFLR